MEQQVRFCTTSDRVRIAYAAAGEGPPIVRVLGWATHLEFEVPVWGWFIDDLAARHLVVRYDGRGMGLSGRAVSDFSLDAKVRDLEAVMDALKLRRFALLGMSEGGPAAITYAVRHPQRVSHLMLYGSFVKARRANSQEELEQSQAVVTLMRSGWGADNPAYRQLFTSFFMPDATVEQIHWFNESQKISATAEAIVALMLANRDIDVTSLLSKVKAPTLVIHRREDSLIPVEQGRQLAALIPGARLVTLEGKNHVLMPEEQEVARMVQAIEDCMTEGSKPAKRRTRQPSAGSSVTVLFTDIKSSTALSQRLGDAEAHKVRRAHDTIVREALKAQGGAEIKHTGDGIMAAFPSASRALECAIAVQRGVADRGDPNLQIHVGLNAGEPVAEDDDLFGTSVDLARRICDQAEGGEILASNVVRELAAGKGFLFNDRGAVALRGFEDPVRIYEVSWNNPADTPL